MFAPFGCDVELTGGEIKRHEEACPCQPLPCPLKGCSALVSRGKLKTHTDKCEYRLIRYARLRLLQENFCLPTDLVRVVTVITVSELRPDLVDFEKVN